MILDQTGSQQSDGDLENLTRNNKSEEVKLNIYPLSDCQALYIIQIHLNIYLHFFISKIIIER